MEVSIQSFETDLFQVLSYAAEGLERDLIRALADAGGDICFISKKQSLQTDLLLTTAPLNDICERRFAVGRCTSNNYTGSTIQIKVCIILRWLFLAVLKLQKKIFW